MSEKPILFSGPMIRALLDGTKTKTRRVIKPPLPSVDTPRQRNIFPPTTHEPKWYFRDGYYADEDHDIGNHVACPYGVPGNRLWVRETFGPCDGGYCYRASEGPNVKPDGGKWFPSIFMPRDACRLHLEITEVRVERLQDISEEDAKAEGVEKTSEREDAAVSPYLPSSTWKGYMNGERAYRDTARESYQSLWDSLNAKRGFGWATNPWVWVIAFRRVDALRAQERRA